MELKTQDRKEKGATMIEYALMVALIAIVALVAVQQLGLSVSNSFNTTSASLGN